MISSTSGEGRYGASRDRGTVSFPTSCSFAASARVSSSHGLSPSAAPIRALSAATCSACERNRTSPALAREKSASMALGRLFGMIDVEFMVAGRPALPHSGDASAFPPSAVGREPETVPDTLPLWVAESAGRPGRAEAPSSTRRSGRLRPAGLGNKARIVVVAVLLAL